MPFTDMVTCSGKALQTEGSESAQSSTLGSASDYASSASNMLAGASSNQQHDGPNEAWGSSGGIHYDDICQAS